MIELPEPILRCRPYTKAVDRYLDLALKGGMDSWFMKQFPADLYQKLWDDAFSKWKRCYAERLEDDPSYPIPATPEFKLEPLKDVANGWDFRVELDGLYDLMSFSCMRFPGQCAGFLLTNPSFRIEHIGCLKAAQPIWEAMAIADGYSTFVASSNKYINENFFTKRGFKLGHSATNYRTGSPVYWWFKDLPSVSEYQKAWREEHGNKDAVESR